jgi:hypothetical protein
MAKRLGTEPPPWWQATLRKGEVHPDMHHAFDIEDDVPVAAPARVKPEKDGVTIVAGKRSIKLTEGDFGAAVNLFRLGGVRVALLGEAESFLLFVEMFGVDSRSGRRLWTANVWGSGRMVIQGVGGPEPEEIRRHKDTVIVYGAESHAMYAEGFDAKTGKCLFRFSSCYWFNFSEAWGLK